MKYECENKDLKEFVTEEFYLDDKCTVLYQTHGYPENSCFSKLVGSYQKAFCTKTHVSFRDFKGESTCSYKSKYEVVREMKLGECIKMSPYIWIKYNCPKESVDTEFRDDPTVLIIIIASGVVVSLVIVAVITSIIALLAVFLIKKSKSKNEPSIYNGLDE